MPPPEEVLHGGPTPPGGDNNIIAMRRIRGWTICDSNDRRRLGDVAYLASRYTPMIVLNPD